MTKQEKQQLEIFKADVSWFHIFKELIRNKTWARLSSNSKSLYPVIKAFVNHENGSAFPSLDTLEEYSGISRPSVVKALKELEAEGLLIKISGTRNSSNNYAIVEKFHVKDNQGQPMASVSFDYMPAYIKDAVAELKNFVVQGLTTPDGKTNYIRIENLVLNVINGNQGTQIQQFVTPEEAIKQMKEIVGKKPVDK